MPRKLSLKRRHSRIGADYDDSTDVSNIDSFLEQCTTDAPSSSSSSFKWCGYHPATAMLLMTCGFLAVLALQDSSVSFHRAVAMAIEAQAEIDAEKTKEDEGQDKLLPWIDARFTVKQDGGETAAVYRPFLQARANVVTTILSNDAVHAGYRYQIDIGGGGGTSWTGTISKLLMHGLLFHHETLTKDFFYDEMKPYVHYVPIKQDLSDLKEKYDWAESHPAEAQAIAKAGTELALRLGSEEYIRELYDELFVQHVGKVIDSYQPQEGETVESILAAYEEAGVPLREYGECDAAACRWGDDGGVRPYVTGVESLKKTTTTSDEIVSAIE